MAPAGNRSRRRPGRAWISENQHAGAEFFTGGNECDGSSCPQARRRVRVTGIYTYSGDGINGIVGPLRRAGNQPGFVQPHHEQLCAFRACAQATFTGRVGICLATSGPGAIHLLNGVYDACWTAGRSARSFYVDEHARVRSMGRCEGSTGARAACR